MQRILGPMLTILLLLVALSGCSDKGSKPPETSSSAPPTTTTTTLPPGDTTPPPAPVLQTTAPVSPANHNDPFLQGVAEPGSNVTIHLRNDCTDSPVGYANASQAGPFEAPVRVKDNTATTFFALATDGAGNRSPCSNGLTYTESSTLPDTTPPAAATLQGTTPASPANNNNPLVRGRAEPGSKVRVYGQAACAGAVLGEGTTDPNGQFSILSPVADNAAASFTARATDAAGNLGPCSPALAFVEDSLAPGQTVLQSTTPASPSSRDDPAVAGTAEAGSTVTIYTAAACAGFPAGTGLAGATGAFLITVAAAPDSSNTLTGRARDAAGNEGPCSSGLTYVEDSTPPAAPLPTGSDPASPSNNNGPRIIGTAEPLSTVRVFSTAGCTGSALGQTTAAANGQFEVVVNVPSDTTTALRAHATDAAGNVSPCSAVLNYQEDSTPPGPPQVVDTFPGSPANNPTPKVRGTAEPSSTVRIYPTGDCSGPASGIGTADASGSFNISVTVTQGQTLTLRARATDAVNNPGACSATSVQFTYDGTPPTAPASLHSVPQSPSQNPNPSVGGTTEAGATVRIFKDACTGAAAAQGTADPQGSFTIGVTVAQNQTTALLALAVDAAGNAGPCSPSIAYVHDQAEPVAPSNVSTDPATGPQDPLVRGRAEAGSLVRVFNVSVCDTRPVFLVGQGSALANGTFSIQIDLPDDPATYFLVVSSTDLAQNESDCSTPIAYAKQPPPP